MTCPWIEDQTFHRAIYWFAQVFSHRLGAPRSSSSGTVVSSQPSTRSAGVLLLLGFPSSGPVHYPLSTLLSPDWRVKSLSGNNTFWLWLIGKGKSHKKWALNEDDPVDCKNYLWRLLNNQKLQFVFSICSQGKVIWFISVKCWRDESQSNKSHFSNLSLHIQEGIISLHLKGLFLFFSRQHSIT